VHIHFKISHRSAFYTGYEFTSQLFFDEAMSDAIYAENLFEQRPATTSNADDGILLLMRAATLNVVISINVVRWPLLE